jgi:hypothetical protein
MRILRTLFVIVILLLNFKVALKAQGNLKPKFKQIELAIYDFNSPRTKQDNKVELLTYVTIDQNGAVKIVDKNYNGVKHYTYQLSDSMINTLNEVFNGKKQLNKYMAARKLEEGIHFAGYYNFITYQTINNKNDTLSFIEPYMSTDFNAVFRAIKNVVYRQPKTEIKASNTENETVLQAIASEHKKSGYLPTIEMPPPAAN